MDPLCSSLNAPNKISMPYKSDKQRKFFEACRAGADMQGKCPPAKVLAEFHQETYHPTQETSAARKAQKKRGDIDYH